MIKIASILANFQRANTLEGQQTFSLTRNVLTIVGGLMLGSALFTEEVGELWEIIVGAALSCIGILLSIFDKAVGIERIQGTLRRILSTIGGIFLGSGTLDDVGYNEFLALGLALIPILQGLLSRKKASQVATGEINPQLLKGANDENLK